VSVRQKEQKPGDREWGKRKKIDLSPEERRPFRLGGRGEWRGEARFTRENGRRKALLYDRKKKKKGTSSGWRRRKEKEGKECLSAKQTNRRSKAGKGCCLNCRRQGERAGTEGKKKKEEKKPRASNDSKKKGTVVAVAWSSEKRKKKAPPCVLFPWDIRIAEAGAQKKGAS